jgi:hypothetical protein
MMIDPRTEAGSQPLKRPARSRADIWMTVLLLAATAVALLAGLMLLSTYLAGLSRHI